MLFQDFSLIPAMSVAENIALFLEDLKMVIDMRQVDQRIQELADRYNLQVRSQVKVVRAFNWRAAEGGDPETAAVGGENPDPG